MLQEHIITMVQCYLITNLNDGLMLLLVMLISSNAYTIVIVFSYLIWLKHITITVMLKLVDIHIFFFGSDNGYFDGCNALTLVGNNWTIIQPLLLLVAQPFASTEYMVWNYGL